MRRLSYVLMILLITLGFALRAQITGGGIIGNVTDPSGATLAGAAVEAANVDTGVVNKTVTNDAGKYEFPLLPAGRYVVRVEASGFQRATTSDIVLHAGTESKIDFKMVLGQLTESVQVVAVA